LRCVLGWRSADLTFCRDLRRHLRLLGLFRILGHFDRVRIGGLFVGHLSGRLTRDRGVDLIAEGDGRSGDDRDADANLRAGKSRRATFDVMSEDGRAPKRRAATNVADMPGAVVSECETRG
jgi:hypothetical protein